MVAANAGDNTTGRDRMKNNAGDQAVADAGIQAVIVSASKDLIERKLRDTVQHLDVPSNADQNSYVYHLNHGDPEQVLQVLQECTLATTRRADRVLVADRERRAHQPAQRRRHLPRGNTTSSLGSSSGNSMGSGNGPGSGRLP